LPTESATTLRVPGGAATNGEPAPRGRAAEQPLKDPSLWLGRGWSALLLRWRAGQAVRAALFADPRTAIYATLEKLRYLPGDPWMVARAAALGVLQSGSVAGPPDATNR
jgi:hypothetical protein